jgi:hypothetical protein
MPLKYPYLILIFLFLFLGGVHYVRAEESGLTVSPMIIDEKVKPRDILEKKIKIDYNVKDGGKANIYAVVYDFKDKDGNIKYSGPGSSDKEDSIASWISLSRGANELMPGQSVDLPLVIKVNFNAKPGKYYAVIYYVNAHDGYAAESMSQSGAWPKTNINLEVLDHKVEKAQIIKFISRSNVYLDGPADIMLQIRNIGNDDIVPGGSIRIYDRRGEEIEDLPINKDKKTLTATEESMFSAVWAATGRIGKFKALADVNYGADNDKNFQDTIFFWVIPKKILIMFGAGIIILTLLLGLIIFRRNKMSMEIQKGKSQGEKILNLKQ